MTPTGVAVKRCTPSQREGWVRVQTITTGSRTALMTFTLETGIDTLPHQLCSPTTLIGKSIWSLLSLWAWDFFSVWFNISNYLMQYMGTNACKFVNQKYWIDLFNLFAEETVLTMKQIQKRIVLLHVEKDPGLIVILKTLSLWGERNPHHLPAQSWGTVTGERFVTVMSAGRWLCLIEQREAEHHLKLWLTPDPPEMATIAGRAMGDWTQNKMSGRAELLLSFFSLLLWGNLCFLLLMWMEDISWCFQFQRSSADAPRSSWQRRARSCYERGFYSQPRQDQFQQPRWRPACCYGRPGKTKHKHSFVCEWQYFYENLKNGPISGSLKTLCRYTKIILICS